MLSTLIWLASNVLEVLISIRGFRAKLVYRHPFFYAYIGFVFLQSPLRLFFYRWHDQLYPPVYWATEFVAVLFGCGVVFEIYRVGLEPYPGTARIARAALWLVFLGACGQTFVSAVSSPEAWRMANVWQLERNLRAFQALSIAALLVLFLIYSVRFGKNLNGVLLGYSLFVGVSIIQLTFVSPAGHRLSDFWSYLHPISYDVALAIWLAHLWSFQPALEPAPNFAVRGGYRRAAALTQRRLEETRIYLRKAVWP